MGKKAKRFIRKPIRRIRKYYIRPPAYMARIQTLVVRFAAKATGAATAIYFCKKSIDMGHRETLFYWKWDIIIAAVINAASWIERLFHRKIYPSYLSE